MFAINLILVLLKLQQRYHYAIYYPSLKVIKCNKFINRGVNYLKIHFRFHAYIYLMNAPQHPLLHIV